MSLRSLFPKKIKEKRLWQSSALSLSGTQAITTKRKIAADNTYLFFTGIILAMTRFFIFNTKSPVWQELTKSDWYLKPILFIS